MGLWLTETEDVMGKKFERVNISGISSFFSSTEEMDAVGICEHCIDEIQSLDIGQVYVEPDYENLGDVWTRLE